MARTWRLFFHTVQSLLRGVHLNGRSIRAGIWGLIIGIFLHICLIFLSMAMLPVAAQVPVVPSSPSPSQLMQRGSELYKAGNFSEAMKVWQQAVAAYKKVGDRTGVTKALINQTLAMEELGLDRRACDTLLQAFGSTDLNCQKLSQEDEKHQQRLSSLLKTLAELPTSLTTVLGLRSLGDALQLVGNLEASQEILAQSLALAQKLNSSQDISAAFLSLGNTAKAQQHKKEALNFYKQAASESASPTTKLQAQLSQLSILTEIEKLSDSDVEDCHKLSQLNAEACHKLRATLEQLSEAERLWPQIFSQIENDKLPPTLEIVYDRINLAKNLLKLSQNLIQMSVLSPQSLVLPPQSLERLLTKAVDQAQSLSDQRAVAYALGNLAELYEKTKQLSKAEELNKKALLIAETINAPDIAYRWQWQLGRLQKDKDREGAIAAYTQAIETLKSLRSDLVATNRDVQFSFKESVEPVYREFVDLLLQPEGNVEPSQQNLLKAREVIESLQLAELDNFFREACLEPKQQIDKLVDKDAPTTAVLYPIILEHQLDIILKLPNQNDLHHYSTPIAQSQVENTLAQLREQLLESDPNAVKEIKSLSNKVYNWLIKPALDNLAQSHVKTLVFVLDGSLRNIPMAALYDGKHYLVENYNTALAPGLNLVDPKAEPLKHGQFRAFIAGLTEKRPEFPQFSALPNVKHELELIQSEVTSSQLLLNQQFTSKAFGNQIQSLPFSVVHLATHGEFGSRADKTFILAWDNQINVNELNDLLRSRDQNQPTAIELLVLSACETAAGDNRAALGIAGVAVQAGARSTIASLWTVKDESTTLLMSKFYQELAKKGLTKAEALRQAQMFLLNQPKYQPPLYWAPFVLLGNWL